MDLAARFGRHVLNQIEFGITKEWLETNGLGSYAMGTIVGVNTRRYHSLFTVSAGQASGRMVMVNRMEESVLINGRRIECSCQEYPGTISPQGHLYLESFSYEPFPRWVYSIEDLKIQKTFFMRSGEETSVVIYRHLSGPPAKLILRPFLSCRQEHKLIREDGRFKGAVRIEAERILCSPQGAPAFTLTAVSRPVPVREAVKIYEDSFWYKNLVYAQEEERELDFQEDLFVPCQIIADLAAEQEIGVVFSTQAPQSIELDRWAEQEVFMRGRIFEKISVQGPFSKRCVAAADQFIVRTNGSTRILRGYPWHETATRESLMSLTGLCLATGRLEEARDILNSASKQIVQGLLPQTFDPVDPSSALYNGMDTPCGSFGRSRNIGNRPGIRVFSKK